MKPSNDTVDKKASGKKRLKRPRMDKEGRGKKESGGEKTVSSGSIPTSRAEQKQRKKARQAARPHGEVAEEAKVVWNKLRQKRLPKEAKPKLLKQLLDLVAGKMYELSLKHDTSRVVQAAIQFSDATQREELFEELKDHIIELSKLTYSSFIVKKLIACGSVKMRANMAKSFEGHVVQMASHNVACSVLEDLFEVVPKKVSSPLRTEFYGKEFALFRHEKRWTMQVIKEEKPDRLPVVLESVAKVISKQVEKQLMDKLVCQQLVKEYLSHAPPDKCKEMSSLLKDVLLPLSSTRDGACASARVIAYADAKDRKKMIKSLKGRVGQCCMHPHGFLVIMQLLEVTDDTVSVQKQILAEMTNPEQNKALPPHGMSAEQAPQYHGLKLLFEISDHFHGSKVLLQLMSPSNKRYLDPVERELLDPVSVKSADGKMVGTSKKDPELRRSELMRFLMTPLSQMVKDFAYPLLRSASGGNILFEFMRTCESADGKEDSAALVDHVVDMALISSETALATHREATKDAMGDHSISKKTQLGLKSHFGGGEEVDDTEMTTEQDDEDGTMEDDDDDMEFQLCWEDQSGQYVLQKMTKMALFACKIAGRLSTEGEVALDEMLKSNRGCFFLSCLLKNLTQLSTEAEEDMSKESKEEHSKLLKVVRSKVKLPKKGAAKTQIATDTPGLAALRKHLN